MAMEMEETEETEEMRLATGQDKPVSRLDGGLQLNEVESRVEGAGEGKGEGLLGSRWEVKERSNWGNDN